MNKKFLVTEYNDDPKQSFGITKTVVKAKDIDDGIRVYLDSKGEKSSKRYVLCSILQSNTTPNTPFKNFTFGERKKTNVSEYVTNIQNAMILPTK